MTKTYTVVEREDGTFCAACMGVRILANPGTPTDRDHWQAVCDKLNSRQGHDEILQVVLTPSTPPKSIEGLAPCILPNGAVDTRIAPAIEAIRQALAHTE